MIDLAFTDRDRIKLQEAIRATNNCLPSVAVAQRGLKDAASYMREAG